MTPLQPSAAVLDAQIGVYEAKMQSGSARVALVIAEIEDSLSHMMTTEEWTASLRGMWPDLSTEPELALLVEKYNDYLSLQHDFWTIRGFLAEEIRFSWYLD